jgi:molecular chaperone DnaJ
VRAPSKIDLSVDLYALLGVSRASTGAEIRRAYRRLALIHHPDRAGAASAETFGRIAEAYRMLSDPTARSAYDAHLLQRGSRSPFGTAEGKTGGSWNVSGVGWSASWERPAPVRLERFCRPLEALTAEGSAQLGSDGLLELRLSPDEAARGGTAVIEMSLSIFCPTCGGVASPRGVWCLRCEYTGRVTEVVGVQLSIPPAARDGAIVTATVRQAGVAAQRARLRVVGAGR